MLPGGGPPQGVADHERGVLDSIVHASRKEWARDDAALANLIRALDDVLDPMANLCSGGASKTMSSRKLHGILDRTAAR